MYDDLVITIKALAQIAGAITMVVGAVGGATYFIFKRYSENWLDQKFRERLEKFKHEQQKELEQLRFEINTLFDRTIKLHQREFEVLPETWTKLIDAYRKAQTLIAHVQSYPDLDRMSAAHLNAFLDICPLAQWKREEVRTSTEPTKAYMNSIFWHQLHETQKTLNDSHTYILRNGIFLPLGLKEKFSAFSELLWHAVIEREHRQGNDGGLIRAMEPKQDELRNTGDARLNELEQEVYARLWSSQRGHGIT